MPNPARRRNAVRPASVTQIGGHRQQRHHRLVRPRPAPCPPCRRGPRAVGGRARAADRRAASVGRRRRARGRRRARARATGQLEHIRERALRRRCAGRPCRHDSQARPGGRRGRLAPQGLEHPQLDLGGIAGAAASLGVHDVERRQLQLGQQNLVRLHHAPAAIELLDPAAHAVGRSQQPGRPRVEHRLGRRARATAPASPSRSPSAAWPRAAAPRDGSACTPVRGVRTKSSSGGGACPLAIASASRACAPGCRARSWCTLSALTASATASMRVVERASALRSRCRRRIARLRCRPARASSSSPWSLQSPVQLETIDHRARRPRGAVHLGRSGAGAMVRNVVDEAVEPGVVQAALEPVAERAPRAAAPADAVEQPLRETHASATTGRWRAARSAAPP